MDMDSQASALPTTMPSSTATMSALPISAEITPENDPNPSWTFFPACATYIPPVPSATPSTAADPVSPAASASPASPSRSSRSSPPPASQTHSTSDGTSSGSGIGGPASCTSSSSTPTTHHRILDHCFHLSIETRLKQAEAQYQASTQELAVEQQLIREGDDAASALKQDDWQRRQRSLVDEAVVLGRKGSNVEAIVDGILKSHRSNGPLQTLPRHIKHRLHLCQLTSMVFGRFDVASSTNNSAGLNIYSAFHSRRHGASRAAIRARFVKSEKGQQIQAQLNTEPIPSSLYCRRHHRRDCKRTCCTRAKLQQEQQQALEAKKKLANNYYMTTANVRSKQEDKHRRVAGMVDAIPAFLKCSAMSYRDIAKSMVDKGELKSIKDMKVEEGWYRLLLEMMTQAVIESYLCDENTGFETILDVFSFGDDPETVIDYSNQETTPAAASTATTTTTLKDIDDLDDGSGTAGTVSGVEGLQFQNLSGLGSTPPSMSRQTSSSSPVLHDVTTQDRQDDILFAKTPLYAVFKKAKDERLQEFLTLDNTTMEQHFADLATKYPLISFERQMTHFIARSQKLLVDPALSAVNQQPIGLLIPPTTSAYADGSLSMPVSEDEDEDEDMDEPSIKLEEIKEEDEDEAMDEEQSHRGQFPTPPLSVVVIKEEKKSHAREPEDEDDDDNSTAARVVQVSKKHKHHSGVDPSAKAAPTKGSEEVGHAIKKVKM
ncbi:hypothetical protein KVV02_005514 [Mortierella alpina]|uniref:Uncharacterized protein n=1 Tax=Mortierella alpina TaxID=64518 RepID=A0A9P8A9H1_MORAP|nr:hypothetical protein KVV02_005514 [Mortierella alpina]